MLRLDRLRHEHDPRHPQVLHQSLGDEVCHEAVCIMGFAPAIVL
jgi:hypothetical protein